jgi:hypothetical protein
MTTDALRSTGSRTIARVAVTGRPTPAELVDAGFLLALGLVALWGFRTSFDSPQFLLAGGVGLVLGIAVAHVSTVLRQHWLVLALMTVVAFFLVGGAVALRRDAVAGVLPGPAVVKQLGMVSVSGWKDFLTTLPPVDGGGAFLVLPYVIGLLVGVTGFAAARRTQHMAWPAAVPVAAFGLVLLLGTVEPAAALAQGLSLSGLAFLWVAVRRRRRLHVVGTGTGHRSQVAVGAALLVVALGVGSAMAHASPVSSDRFVLRSVVAPPFDVTKYPSPLVGFRKYTEGAKWYWDQELLQVSGAQAGSRLRLAVLDDYSGTVWAASPPGAGGGFRRVGTTIAPSSGDPTTAPQTVTVTIGKAYAGLNDLDVWVPGLGSATRIAFGGPRAAELADALRYDTGTGQAVLSTRLRAGDTVTSTVRPVPTLPERGISPGGGTLVPPGVADFVVAPAAKLAGKAEGPWPAVAAAAQQLRNRGAYSDGTSAGERQYLPGHGAGRLTAFLAGPQFVGNDEQYASTFALVANSLGVPARVVLGAVVPDGGTVKGSDVHAWVEVQDGSGQWYAVPEGTFMPDRDKHPDEKPPPPVAEQNATDVPPPNAVRPPGSLDSLLSLDPSSVRVPDSEGGAAIPEWLWTLLRWVGLPLAVLLAVVGSLAGIHALRRRHRRRTGPTSRRLAHGWTDLVDRARDLGTDVPRGLTRREQAGVVGFAALAAQADAAVFGAGEPSEEAVDRYWRQVATARKDLTARSPIRRRVTRRFALTSLAFRDPRPVETHPARQNPPADRFRRGLRLRAVRSTA